MPSRDRRDKHLNLYLSDFWLIKVNQETVNLARYDAAAETHMSDASREVH
jgi:hypothetical protein